MPSEGCVLGAWCPLRECVFFFFFFNDPAPPEIYPLPLHDALPISKGAVCDEVACARAGGALARSTADLAAAITGRSEEHTSELQSQSNLVCRLLLEKKKTQTHRVACA